MQLRRFAAASVAVPLAAAVSASAGGRADGRILIEGAGEFGRVYAAQPGSRGCAPVLRLPRARTTAPAFSPDGRSAAVFVLRGRPPTERHELRVLSLAGGHAQSLGRVRQEPVGIAWSPNSRGVAYTDGATLVTVGLGGRQPRAIKLRRRPLVAYAPLAWSPDGSRVTLSTAWGDYNSGTYANALEVVDLRSGRLTTLDRNPNPYTARFTVASWSPDGATIVYDRGDPSEIFTIAPDASRRRRLTQRRRGPGDRAPVGDARPAWSPNGEEIAFTSTRSGQEEVYLMSADGSGERRLTFSPQPGGGSRALAWSPDGEWIAAGSITRDRLATALVILRADGDGRRELCRFRGTRLLNGVWVP
jgi:Tol biopolymer transport system component